MRSRKKAIPQNVKRIIRRAQSIVIATHVNPEGDALGSQFALAYFLMRRHKDVRCVLYAPLQDQFRFLGNKKIAVVRPDSVKKVFDLMIVLDSPSIERTGLKPSFLMRARKVLNIDHHISNSFFGDVNWVVPDASSTAEILSMLFYGLTKTIPHYEAQCLYAGIMTDTGSFRYDHTSDKTFLLASRLVGEGVSPTAVYRRIYEGITKKDSDLFASFLLHARFYAAGKVIYLQVPLRLMRRKNSAEIIEKAIDHIRQIKGVSIAIAFKEEKPSLVKVSFRSNGTYDVYAFAGVFGGGGHRNASGCTVHAPLRKAKTVVLMKLKNYLTRNGTRRHTHR